MSSPKILVALNAGQINVCINAVDLLVKQNGSSKSEWTIETRREVLKTLDKLKQSREEARQAGIG